MNVDSDLDLESENDWEESSDTSAEESGSDWERTRKKGRQKGNSHSPAKKRVKLSGSVSNRKSINKGKKGSGSLSILLSMPMDILFEVFSRLSPKDLIALTRTNKVLRQTLLTRNAITVWKNLRENIDAPEPFDDFSESRWAWLLFGGTNCHSCGAKGIQKIDFMLRRRVCVGCRKTNLVFSAKFSTKFPDYEEVILDFIPHTNVGGWAHGHASGSKFYWTSDVDDMAYKWGQLQKAVHMRVQGAKQKLEDFRFERMDAVRKVVEHADWCDDWFQTVIDEHALEGRNRRENRYQAIIERFQNLGYIEEDIICIEGQKEVDQDTELTDRIWNRILPILEPFVQRKKALRLEQERAALIQSRTRILDLVYKSYLKTLLPSQWAFHPCTAEVCEFSPFDALVQAPDQVTVSAASFEEAVVMLPGLIATWMQERRQTLLDMLSASSKLSFDTTSPSSNGSALPNASELSTPKIAGPGLSPAPATTSSSHTVPGTVDPLNLATSVFRCGHPACEDRNNGSLGTRYSKVLVAFDGVLTHQCQTRVNYWSERRSIPSIYQFSTEGSAAAVTLVSLAGLKPSSATPRDMDQRDLRFFCKPCGPGRHRGRYGREVFTWRSAISHAVANHGTTPTPNWEILTKEEKAAIKRDEDVDPIKNDSCWTCNHCAVYLDHWESQQNVVNHLETVHGITNWEIPRDIFYIPQKCLMYIPVPIFATTPPPDMTTKPGKTVRCNRCPANSFRLFDPQGVQMHLKAKHKVVNSVENVDWMRVKVNKV